MYCIDFEKVFISFEIIFKDQHVVLIACHALFWAKSVKFYFVQAKLFMKGEIAMLRNTFKIV